MRFSTTTLGCPDWDLDTCLRQLPAWGYAGIDFRGLRGELALWRLPEFSADLAASVTRIRDSGLAVSCISTSIRLVDTSPEVMAGFDEELARSVELCQALDCSQLRIFGGRLGGFAEGAETPELRAAARAHAAERAQAMAEQAPGIDLLVETHDAWTASSEVVALLEAVDRPNVACCWDVKHTWWQGEEAPAASWRRLQPWVRNTHWKDARRCDLDRLPPEVAQRARWAGLLCPVGEGIAPLADCLDLLRRGGYQGWYTLEWEKHWHPHIAGPELAFPGFIAHLQALAERLGDD